MGESALISWLSVNYARREKGTADENEYRCSFLDAVPTKQNQTNSSRIGWEGVAA